MQPSLCAFSCVLVFSVIYLSTAFFFRRSCSHAPFLNDTVDNYRSHKSNKTSSNNSVVAKNKPGQKGASPVSELILGSTYDDDTLGRYSHHSFSTFQSSIFCLIRSRLHLLELRN